tara:strand:+ start:264 stop:485 length:222 start_codon:yes stop_codon:yes gene_type:complete
MRFFTPAIDPSQSQARSRSEISVSCGQNTEKVERSEEKGGRKTKRKPPMRFLLLIPAYFFNQPLYPIRKQTNW